MRNTFLGLATALLLAGPAAAQTTPAGAELQGRLSDALGDALTVSWRSQPLATVEQHRTVHPDVDGNFQLKIPVAQPTAATLSFGDEELTVFLEPGDELELRGNGLELASSAKFSAADRASEPAAAANNYLVELGRRFLNNENYQVLPDNIQLLPGAFDTFLTYRLEHEQALLRQADRRGRLTAAFQAYAQAELTYATADDRLTYADLREQTVEGQTRLELPDSYYAFLQNGQLLPGPAGAASSPRYQDFLLDYVHYQAQATGHRPSSPDYYATCYRLADQLLPAGQPERPVLLGRVVRETIAQGHVAHAQALLSTYAAGAQAPAAWAAQLRTELAEHQSLAIGTLAPALPLRQANGRPLSLADLRGKLVYVQFWDSRYPAGQRLLPFVKEVTEALKEQPIVVVMAALDEQPANWQQVVLALPTASCVQTIVPLPKQAAVRQAYNLSRLPSAVLIGEDGTIVNLHPRDLSSRALQDDLRASVGRAAAYKAVALGQR